MCWETRNAVSRRNVRIVEPWAAGGSYGRRAGKRITSVGPMAWWCRSSIPSVVVMNIGTFGRRLLAGFGSAMVCLSVQSSCDGSPCSLRRGCFYRCVFNVRGLRMPIGVQTRGEGEFEQEGLNGGVRYSGTYTYVPAEIIHVPWVVKARPPFSRLQDVKVDLNPLLFLPVSPCHPRFGLLHRFLLLVPVARLTRGGGRGNRGKWEPIQGGGTCWSVLWKAGNVRIRAKARSVHKSCLRKGSHLAVASCAPLLLRETIAVFSRSGTRTED